MDDTFNVGTPGDNVEACDAPTTLNGGGGTDALNFNDLNDAFGGDVYTITSTTIQRSASGLVTYSSMEGLTVNCNNFDSTINIASSSSATMLVVNGNNGADTFNVGTPGDNVETCDSPTTLNGGGGADILNYNDATNGFLDTYTVTSSTIVRTASGIVTYGTMEGLNVNAGLAANTINVTSAFDNTAIFGNGGADAINIIGNQSGTFVTVDGGSGLDSVQVNGDSVGTAAVQFLSTQDLATLDIFTGGTAVLTAGGAKVLVTQALSVAGTGKLDLTDNDMVIDYSGASPLATLKALLTSGYAGSAWTGNGVQSSVAAANAAKTTGLGLGENSQLGYANFSGIAVDATAILVKYTWYGDASLDGAVNTTDFNLLAGNFGGASKHWSLGDFNFSGTVDTTDFNLLAANFGKVGL